MSSRDALLAELHGQPSPHDLLVERPPQPPPSPREVAGRVRSLLQGEVSADSVRDWADEQVAQHLFPPPASGEPLARTGEALLQLSMLDRLPLDTPVLEALVAFLCDQLSWSGWLEALAAVPPQSAAPALQPQSGRVRSAD